MVTNQVIRHKNPFFVTKIKVFIPKMPFLSQLWDVGNFILAIWSLPYIFVAGN